MGISLSGGDYQYNRFDAFEKDLEESKGASNPDEMKAKVDKAAEKAEKESDEDKKKSKKQEAEQEEGTATGDMVEETLNNEETNETVMEDNQRMAMYSRALGVMGAHYSGPGHSLEEKKEPTDERKEAADRADEEKRQKKEGKKGEAKETEEIEKLEDEKLKEGITKEDVLGFLVSENYATNEVSAEAMFNHMSDHFLLSIEGMISESTKS